MKKPIDHPLAQLRAERNLTRKRLGEEIGVGEATIFRAEHNKPVSAEVRRLLCEYFGMTASELSLSAAEQKANQLPDHSHASVTIHTSASYPSLPSPVEDIIGGKAVNQLEEQDMDKRRRQLLTSGVALVTAPYDVVDPSLLDRFSRIFAAPYQMGERSLQYVAARTSQYWQDRHKDALAPHELLEYVTAHFQKIMNMLEKSLLPSDRKQLCASAGETALLIGTLLFEIGAHIQARSFFQAAIQAANEAEFQELGAVSWGWMSFTFTYRHDYPEALQYIQTARQIAAPSSNLVVTSWLAAVEAEIQANMANTQAALTAIGEAEVIKDVSSENRWTAITEFHHYKFVSYQSVCAKLLYTATEGQSNTLLFQSQHALLDAIAQMNPSLVREQASLHIDLSATYIQQGVAEAAYDHANIAISLAGQAKSQILIQRLSKLRNELRIWKETPLMKNFDEQMRPFLIPQWYRESV